MTPSASKLGPQKAAPKPPKKLPELAKKFWDSILKDFALESHHLELLGAACIQLGRAIEARELLSKDGLTTTNRFGELKEHPAVGIERSATLAFKGLLRELGLDIEPPAESRGYRRPGTRS